jgi:hypothetical protein
MVMAMRVEGDKEGKGSKGLAMVIAIATRVAGKQTGTMTKRAMSTTTREAGKEEGNGKGDTSNGNCNEDGNGKQQR